VNVLGFIGNNVNFKTSYIVGLAQNGRN